MYDGEVRSAYEVFSSDGRTTTAEWPVRVVIPLSSEALEGGEILISSEEWIGGDQRD